MNLYNIIKTTAYKNPNSTAIIYKNTSIDYKHLLINIESVGARLMKFGVKPNQRIGLICKNCPEYIVLSFAILYCNACIVPISDKFKQDERDSVINNVKLNHLIIENTNSAPDNRHHKFKTLDKSFSLVAFSNNLSHSKELLSIKPAFIRFTSGTTSKCKGVVLSHKTILERTKAANKALKIADKDIILWVLPMSYHFAVSIVLYLSVGASIVICDEHMGQPIYDNIKKHKVTLIYAAPFHYRLLSQVKNHTLPKNVRLAISTTSALSTDIFEDFYNKFKFPISQCYGIIEIGLPAINTSNQCKKRKSVGLPLPDYKINIVNADTERKCSINETGIITIKGPGFLDAYLQPWKPRNKILKKGWFITGDYGKLDKDGYLTIEGRHNNLINIAGFKFFPQEVESVLNSHSAVEESKVYGFNHSRFGEIPFADIVLNEGAFVSEPELLNYCKKHLASFKIPFSINFVKCIEKTASGKIKRI